MVSGPFVRLRSDFAFLIRWSSGRCHGQRGPACIHPAGARSICRISRSSGCTRSVSSLQLIWVHSFLVSRQLGQLLRWSRGSVLHLMSRRRCGRTRVATCGARRLSRCIASRPKRPRPGPNLVRRSRCWTVSARGTRVCATSQANSCPGGSAGRALGSADERVQLEVAAAVLGPLLDEVVFVGGTGSRGRSRLYGLRRATSQSRPPVRPSHQACARHAAGRREHEGLRSDLPTGSSEAR